MVLRSLVCCGPANNTIPVDQAFDRSVRAPLSESLREGLEQLGARHHANQLTFGQAIREAMVLQFAAGWPPLLPPHQHAVMSYATSDPRYGITIEYDDEIDCQ